MNQRARRTMITVLTATMVIAFLGSPARATDAYPYTNDQSTTIAVARWFYYGINASQVNNFINQNGARLTQVRIENPATPTFDVSMVANSGAYSATWWWYYGKTTSQVSALLAQNNARLISLDPYSSNGPRFTVVMVSNTGKANRAWWWYYGKTGSEVNTLLSQNNARLVALRSYISNNNLVFAVIMISNTGVDNKGWWWYTADTISDITNKINANQARLITFSADPAGGFDAVMVSSEGEAWWWYYGQTGQQVLNNIVAHGTRLIDISPYISGGNTVYTEVELDDSNPPQSPINSESTRVQAYAEANGWGGGFHGGYFVKASAGSAPLIAYNSAFRFEPASSIKVLYHLYTMKQVQAGNIQLGDDFVYYPDPSDPNNPGVCPDPAWETPGNAHHTTIENGLTQMMQVSNNVMTRGFAKKWGLGPVQAMATGLGMSSTHLNQAFIGCGFEGAVRNELTLADAAKLYRAVQNKSALSGSSRKKFFSILAGGPPSPSDPIALVVANEAAKQGKSGIVAQFLAAMDVRGKAGSYAFCLGGGCNPYKADFSTAGRMLVPFMDPSHNITKKAYLYGDFVNDLVILCAAGKRLSGRDQGLRHDLRGGGGQLEPRSGLRSWAGESAEQSVRRRGVGAWLRPRVRRLAPFDYTARMRLFLGWCSTSASPRASMTGGT